MIRLGLVVICIGLLLQIFSACTNSQAGEGSVNTTKFFAELNEDNMFDGPSVKIAAEVNADSSSVANQLFLNGLDYFRNKGELPEAISLFKASIFKLPTAKSYYELGNAWMELKDYPNALMAYSTAEKLGYEPFSKLLYNLSCVYAQLDELTLAARYLEYAIQAGYANFDHIHKDKDLERLRNTYFFEEHYQRALGGVSNHENIFWLQFKQRFPKAKLPMELKQQVHESFFEGLNYIGYDYEKFVPEMRNDKFSREVSKGYYYYAQVAETENYSALIYIEKDEFLEGYAPLCYKLVCYSPTGKIIDKRLIGGRTKFSEPVLVARIESTGKIVVTNLEVEYEKNPEEVGYYENPVKSSREIGKVVYQISEAGKITRFDEQTLAAH